MHPNMPSGLARRRRLHDESVEYQQLSFQLPGCTSTKVVGVICSQLLSVE